MGTDDVLIIRAIGRTNVPGWQLRSIWAAHVGSLIAALIVCMHMVYVGGTRALG